jgi:hypothetical protein
MGWKRGSSSSQEANLMDLTSNPSKMNNNPSETGNNPSEI